MKKVISITLALIMALSLSVTAFAATITAKTPSTDSNGVYQIGTAAELYGFAQLVNSGQTSINAVLTADIIVNENVLNESGELNSGDFASWTPIGNSSKNYKGTFDGQRHTISGLYFNDSSTDYVGLFGYVSGGEISNVGVIDSYLCGKSRVGGVCGNNSGTITDCYNASTINGSSDYVGGVFGKNSGTITDCYNTGVISGTSYVGGVCGENYNSGEIIGCYNAGVVSGDSSVGGVCGINYGTITDCYNMGTVSGTSNVGGVCGKNFSGTVSACYNMGAVSGTSNVGGVCGNNYRDGYIGGTIKYCYTNSGKVYGTTTGTVTYCAVYSDDAFADGTVIALLNAALEAADSDARFYQVADIDPYPVLTDNSKRSTNVEYTVAETYTVTIPSAVTLGSEAKISASDVVLKKGRQVNVALTGTSDESNAFTVTSGEGAVLEYTVNNGDVKVGDTVLTVDPSAGSGETTLNFAPAESAKFSGSYTGTVTFTISVN